jgi:hypothetical protein
LNLDGNLRIGIMKDFLFINLEHGAITNGIHDGRNLILPECAADFWLNCGHLIEGDAEIHEASHLPISAAILFAIHGPMRLLALWYVERNLEGSGI